jgi:hypothetical protein
MHCSAFVEDTASPRIALGKDAANASMEQAVPFDENLMKNGFDEFAIFVVC